MLELLPRFLEKDGVVAVGEIGFDDQTEAEDDVLARARSSWPREFKLPVLVHTPHRDKKQGTIRIDRAGPAAGFPEERVLIDHNNEETLPIVLETGCWAGHSIYPNTKMDEQRMAALVKKYGTDRIIVNSAADWGISDPLKVPKTIDVMRSSGIPDDAIQQDRVGQPGGVLRAERPPRCRATSNERAGDRPLAASSKPTPCCAATSDALRPRPSPPRASRPRSSTSSASPTALLGPDTPHLNALAARRHRWRRFAPSLPAVTCTAQATYPHRAAARATTASSATAGTSATSRR